MHRVTRRGLVVALLFVTAAYAVAEEVTLTTYYPSPRGIYEALIVRGTVPQLSVSSTGGQPPGNTSDEAILNLMSLDVNGNGQFNPGAMGLPSDRGWHLVARGPTYSTAAEQGDLMFWRYNNGGYTNLIDFDFPTGNIGIGTATPGIAKTYISNPGTNVGLYVGNGIPFGQAQIELDGPPATHLWAAENGTNVFNVAAGGSGFFAGNVSAVGTVTAGTVQVGTAFGQNTRITPGLITVSDDVNGDGMLTLGSELLSIQNGAITAGRYRCQWGDSVQMVEDVKVRTSAVGCEVGLGYVQNASNGVLPDGSNIITCVKYRRMCINEIQ